MKNLFKILFLCSIVAFTHKGRTGELYEISFTPCQDAFLYGTEVVLHFQVRNLTNDTLWIYGIHETDYVQVIEKGLGSQIEWDKITRIHETYYILKPNQDIEVLRSYFILRPSNTSHNENDPIKKRYYPLGTFHAYACVLGINSATNERQEKSVECQFRVILPQGTEKDVFELFLSGKKASRIKNFVDAIEIYKEIIDKYPNSGYIHMVVHSLIGALSLEHGIWESAGDRFKYANWYLHKYPDFYSLFLEKAVAVTITYYMVNNDRNGLIRHLKELNMQFPGTRLELDNNATIMEYEKMSDAKFNKAHEVKKPID